MIDSANLPLPRSRWRRAAAVSQGRKPPVALSLLALLISGLVLIPIGYLILRAVQADGGIWDLVSRQRTLDVLINTLVLAMAVGITAAVIAIPSAWLLLRTDVPFARVLTPACALPLVIPSYVGALAYIAALGPRGSVQQWLSRTFDIDRFPSLYGFTGAWLTLSLFTFPYVFLTVSAALRRIDPQHEEAARSLGKGPVGAFFWTTLAQLRPAAVSGMLLASLYAVSDFGVVTLFRYDSLTRAIFVQYRSSFDRSYAAVLALILVLFAMLLLLLDSLLQGRAAYFRVGSGVARKPRRVSIGRWRYLGLIWILTILGLALATPIIVLVQWLVRTIRRGDEIDSLLAPSAYTVGLGAAAAIICILLALPISLLSTRYQSRLGTLSERLVYIGYGLPGIVVGLSFVFLGANYLPRLYQTTALLLVAYSIRFLPQAVATTRSSFLQISPRLEEAARGLGRTPVGAFLSVTAPISVPGLTAGLALVFLTVVKELPITLLLRPTGSDTLATEVWSAAGAGRFGEAAAPSLVLIALSAVPAILVFGGSRETSTRGEE